MIDLINSAFEALASIAILNHCLTVLRHKEAKGVSALSTAFFTIWGLWNVIYYPALGQMFSFYAGCAVCLVNSWYVYLIWKFRKPSQDDELLQALIGVRQNFLPSTTEQARWWNENVAPAMTKALNKKYPLRMKKNETANGSVHKTTPGPKQNDDARLAKQEGSPEVR